MAKERSEEKILAKFPRNVSSDAASILEKAAAPDGEYASAEW